MKKNHYDSDISAYLDGELEPRRHATISQHIAGCPECQQQLLILQRMRSASAKLRTFRTNPFFAQKVLAAYRIRRQESFWSSFALIPRAIVQGAIIVAVAILLLLFWPQSTHKASESGVPLPSEYRIILDEDWAMQTIETNDQALTFALNQNGGEAK